MRYSASCSEVNSDLIFALACGNCWHIYEAVEKSDHPKLLHAKLPAASAEMWLRHKSARS